MNPPYRAILADPPWSFESWSEKGAGKSAKRHYNVMELHAIKSMPVGSTLAHPDGCVLFMWAVDSMLPEALEVIKAWGFTFKTVAFTWVKAELGPALTTDLGPVREYTKEHFGMGYWTRGNPEMCLLATRGKPQKLSSSVRQLVVSPRREHSRKPDEIRTRIENLVPGPYLELFARSRAPGWDAWGNEINKFPIGDPHESNIKRLVLSNRS